MIRMYLLTMRKILMNALVFFLFTNQILHISGTMTVFHEPSKKNVQIYLFFTKSICISEDDGGALVWNNYLNWQYHNQTIRFSYLKGGIPNCEINCEMNADQDCLKSWILQDWSLTNSVKTPMGPVFDQRWEEFQEYTSQTDRYEFIDFEDTIATNISISIRGSRDAHILLCNSKNYYNDFCYWIIIGGWNNTRSVIRKCATGVPLIGNWPKDPICKKTQVSIQHTPLSATEWRSFTITWDSVTRNISVYNTYNIIMTYQDAEEPKFPNITYHLFIRSNEHILFRFHIYNFLHTTIENILLTSPIVQLDNQTICVQMLIGLCTECDAYIMLRDSTNYSVLEEMVIKGSSKAAIHGLPMWQFVQIQKNLATINYKNVILQVIPKLSTPSSNPLWAIANVHRCPTNDSLRWSYIYNYKDGNRETFWANITCQKLFYDNHTVIKPKRNAKPDMKFDYEDCPLGKIGPQCLINCGLDLESYHNCKETVICYKDDCTCSPGFLGSKCSTSCKSHTYGYGCKKKCGACREISIGVQAPCNAITGICHHGCKNLYIPPLCQQKIDKLNTPEVTSTNTTSIQTMIPITWKKEYEKITILYSCTLQGQMEHHKQPWKKVFPNMTHLIGYFENLKPGTIYEINCALNVAGSNVHSDWQNVETDCNPIENFDMKPGETNMIIDWQINADVFYPCPANWYHLIVRNLNTDDQIVNESVIYFPYNLTQLTPYTLFNVTILYKSDKVFSQQIRTVESVPSSVLDLKIMISFNTLNLIWGPPDQPNGEIVRYEIKLKIKEYYGCKDLQLPTPDNHIITKITKNTTIIIPDLHPYASYSVQITAHNARYNSMAAENSFDTKSSEIPTEVFSYLEVQDWKLMWSPPENCTTISGPIKARIKVRGISDSVKDKIYKVKQTGNYSFDLNKVEPKLHGAERYLAKIYVIRDYASQENASAYKEYEFETPPTAPPSVINLEVIEIDARQIPVMIHLRWQRPRPPLNGKLHYYGIQSCDQYNNKCPIMKVQLNKFCDLWDDYICQIIQKPFTINPKIQVLAYNMNVTEPSPPISVTNQMLSNTKPDAPENITFIINNNSVIELKWHHPWRTGGHLQSFHIYIEEISSNLRRQRLAGRSLHSNLYEYPVAHYMRNYSMRLYSFPSTQYRIHIKAVTVANVTSKDKYIEVHTPSTISFDGNLDVMIDKLHSMISLNIPPVLNDTNDSKMHIIVKGPNSCEQHSEVPESLRSYANVKMYDIAWQAAEIPTSDFAGKPFTLGDNRIYGGARNCPLKLEESYEIVVIITEQNSSKESIMFAKSIRIGEVPPKHHEAWIIPIILLLIVAAFYLHQRKRQKSNKQPIYDDIVLISHYIADVAEYHNNLVNCENETKFVISNSKQELSTSSDRQSLSQSTTPEVLPRERRREEGGEHNIVEESEIFLGINFHFYQE